MLPFYLLLAASGVARATKEACSRFPYALFKPLACYPLAQCYCSSEYPRSASTSTVYSKTYTTKVTVTETATNYANTSSVTSTTGSPSTSTSVVYITGRPFSVTTTAVSTVSRCSTVKYHEFDMDLLASKADFKAHPMPKETDGVIVQQDVTDATCGGATEEDNEELYTSLAAHPNKHLISIVCSCIQTAPPPVTVTKGRAVQTDSVTHTSTTVVTPKTTIYVPNTVLVTITSTRSKAGSTTTVKTSTSLKSVGPPRPSPTRCSKNEKQVAKEKYGETFAVHCGMSYIEKPYDGVVSARNYTDCLNKCDRSGSCCFFSFDASSCTNNCYLFSPIANHRKHNRTIGAFDSGHVIGCPTEYCWCTKPRVELWSTPEEL